MDEFNESVETSEVAEPTEEQATEPIENVSSEVVDTQVEEVPVQDAKTNAMYAEMRRKAQAEAQIETQKAIDSEYSRLYGQEFNIHTKADYDNAVKAQEREQQIAQEAEKQGIPEDLVRRLKDLEDTNKETLTQKQEYERQLNLIKEDSTLKSDETFSEYYTENEAVIKDMANNYGVDLTTAMLLSIKDNFKAIKEGATKKAEQDTINNIIKNKNTSTGSLALGGSPQSNVISEMSSKDFNALTDKVLRGEKIKF